MNWVSGWYLTPVSESESLGVPTLLGAAIGIVAVLLLLLTVSVMIARHSRLCRDKGVIRDQSPPGTPGGSVWECYESRPSPPSRNHQIVEGEEHAQSYTSLLETYPESPRKHLNSHILNHPTKCDNVEVSCQVSQWRFYTHTHTSLSAWCWEGIGCRALLHAENEDRMLMNV